MVPRELVVEGVFAFLYAESADEAGQEAVDVLLQGKSVGVNLGALWRWFYGAA